MTSWPVAPLFPFPVVARPASDLNPRAKEASTRETMLEREQWELWRVLRAHPATVGSTWESSGSAELTRNTSMASAVTLPHTHTICATTINTLCNSPTTVLRPIKANSLSRQTKTTCCAMPSTQPHVRSYPIHVESHPTHVDSYPTTRPNHTQSPS